MSHSTPKSSAVLGTVLVTGSALAAAVAAARRKRPRASPAIADAMTRDPVCVDVRTSTHQAATRMAEEGVGAVAVCDDGAAVGILTDRDLVVRLVAQAADPMRTTVGEILEGELETIDVDDTLPQAAERMRTRGVRRLPVLRHGRLAGIVTQADVAERDPASAAALERSLTRAPADARSAAWLFRKPYRDTPGPLADQAVSGRVADGQLTQATRAILAERRSEGP